MDRYLLEAKTGTKIAPKTILLVRHGQSEHNAHAHHHLGVDLNDKLYIDAPLTALGREQAQAISKDIAQFNPQLIVVSPLTRAVQTGLLASSQLSKSVPFVVNKLCAERMAYSCDIGSSVSVLKSRFPHLDFSGIDPPDIWWWTKLEDGVTPSVQRTLELLNQEFPGVTHDGIEPLQDLMKRINEFRMWLLQRPETRIAVFAHGVFLYNFANDGAGYFGNCEMRKIVL